LVGTGNFAHPDPAWQSRRAIIFRSAALFGHEMAAPRDRGSDMVAQMTAPLNFSQTWTFFEGNWHEGNVPIMGPRTHAAWLGSVVFDGARAFEGVAPDLDRHCARVNRSAVNFKLKPIVDTETWLGLAREGIARFDANAELYIRPMYWPQTASGGGVLFDPESTNWCLCIYVAPLPPPTGSAITLSPFRRPSMECAPVDAKAACLYPNNSRALMEAQARGFNNCLLLDLLGNVAEFGNSNVFMAKDGVVYTPVPNGTFLNGITRQRVIDLLRGDGVTIVETTLSYADFLGADEIFSSGNFAKVAPIIRIDERSLQPGPFYNRARKLYWDFAHA
jgi:branched-chain amino acid aminotransferase